MRRRRAWLVVALLALGSCSRHAGGPGAPPPPLPPHVVQVWPVPESSGILEQAPLWAQFDTDLDPTTVDDHHVFLKLDTRRLPIAVSWDPSTRRILIQPLAEMTRAHTYTVELGSLIRTAEGATLDGGYWWQFQVVGVADPVAQWPVPGAANESPVVRLEWQGTEAAAGPTHYQLFVGPDSGAVAARAVAPLADVTTSAHPADAPWPLGSTIYWAVTAFNTATMDRRDGPVASFQTLPPGTPTTTQRLQLRDWGYVIRDGPRSCNVQLNVGTVYHSTMRWDWMRSAVDLRLAAAKMELGVQDSFTDVRVFGTRDTWDPCTMTFPGPPHAEPTWDIGRGHGVSSTLRRYDSVRLASLLEAITRGRGVDGWVMTLSSSVKEFVSTKSTLDVTYYVLPPSPRASTSAGAAGPTGGPRVPISRVRIPVTRPR